MPVIQCHITRCPKGCPSPCAYCASKMQYQKFARLPITSRCTAYKRTASCTPRPTSEHTRTKHSLGLPRDLTAYATRVRARRRYTQATCATYALSCTHSARLLRARPTPSTQAVLPSLLSPRRLCRETLDPSARPSRPPRRAPRPTAAIDRTFACRAALLPATPPCRQTDMEAPRAHAPADRPPSTPWSATSTQRRHTAALTRPHHACMYVYMGAPPPLEADLVQVRRLQRSG
jgi:hypothetical protein